MLTSSRAFERKPYLAVTAKFRAGQDTPRAFLERCLEVIASLEPKVGAFEHLDVEKARAVADASAARWQANRPLSPIDGMPLGIKDIIETADMPTGMGSPLFTGWRSERDAATVKALREAGGVILGKTVTTEFAATEPGKTANPWDLMRTPGGSSSGSAAAVGSGMLPAALGTQVIGSIIRPSSYCGCFGFKPTVGAINRGGSHDFLSQSADGVLAASLEDLWQVAYEIAIRAGGDPGYPGLAGPASCPAAAKPRALAVLETAGWAVAAPEAKTALERALEKISAAGVRLIRRDAHQALGKTEAAVADAFALSHRINAWESRWPLNTYRDRDSGKLSRAMLERLKQAEAFSLDEYREALKMRQNIRTLYAELGSECDGYVTLSAPGAAPLGLQSTGNPAFAVPGSLLGVPTLSLPLLQSEGLPLGLQIMGFENRDADAFATAGWVYGLLRQS